MVEEAMNPEAMNAALDAIHDEAVRLLSLVSLDASDLHGGLELIISLSRYKHDIRSVEEIKKTRSE